MLLDLTAMISVINKFLVVLVCPYYSAPAPAPAPCAHVDPAVSAAFLSRASHRSRQTTHRSPPVRAAAIRSFRATSRPTSSRLWSVLGVGTDAQHMEAVANMLNALVDFFDEGEQSEAVLSAWRGFEIEQHRQFPKLVPTTAVGAGYARSRAGTSSSPNMMARRVAGAAQVWDYVATRRRHPRLPRRLPCGSSLHPPWVGAPRAQRRDTCPPRPLSGSSTPAMRVRQRAAQALVRKWWYGHPGGGGGTER
ncbi:hypothetical protein B0H14DRAFT_3529849 [Mycena olivaceomarginata]|nr:hypothetical protein B0H14DRAFT_3529849 [Mycena olivaceomarginata]